MFRQQEKKVLLVLLASSTRVGPISAQQAHELGYYNTSTLRTRRPRRAIKEMIKIHCAR